jgi:hypothetical protein
MRFRADRRPAQRGGETTRGETGFSDPPAESGEACPDSVGAGVAASSRLDDDGIESSRQWTADAMSAGPNTTG